MLLLRSAIVSRLLNEKVQVFDRFNESIYEIHSSVEDIVADLLALVKSSENFIYSIY